MIPDITLTTACYDLTKYYTGARTIEQNIQLMETLLEIDCFLCIFGDSTTLPLIKEIRNGRFGLGRLTHYIELPLEKLWAYKYGGKIRANRQIYYPTDDNRSSVESHVVQCNKFDFVLHTIKLDPFHTTKFGWIDANIGVNAKKISENYTKEMFLNVLHNISDNFHIQILNVEDKALIAADRLKEYYERYRWIMCGCLFTTSKHVGIPVLNRLKEVFIETTMLGYGHGEEPLFIGILEEFYDSIDRSYGDYQHILNNFIRHTRGYQYIYDNLLKRYMNYGYFREGYDCSKHLVADFEVSDTSNSLQFLIHYMHLLFAMEYKKEEVGRILKDIKQNIVSGKYKEEYIKGKATYLEKFRSCMVVAKATRRNTGGKIRNTRRGAIKPQTTVNPS
jgi:hypothetical protein